MEGSRYPDYCSHSFLNPAMSFVRILGWGNSSAEPCGIIPDRQLWEDFMLCSLALTEIGPLRPSLKKRERASKNYTSALHKPCAS